MTIIILYINLPTSATKTRVKTIAGEIQGTGVTKRYRVGVTVSFTVDRDTCAESVSYRIISLRIDNIINFTNNKFQKPIVNHLCVVVS